MQAAAIRARTGSVRGVPRDTQWRRREEIERIKAEARREVATLAKDPFWVAGTVMYWAEGGKRHRHLAMANSDPAALRLFIGWVRTYLMGDAVFVLSMHLHAGNDEEAARAFWRTQLGLPNAEFWKTYIKPRGTGHRRNHLAHGVCRVFARLGTDAWIRALEWIDVLRGDSGTSRTGSLLSSTSGR